MIYTIGNHSIHWLWFKKWLIPKLYYFKMTITNIKRAKSTLPWWLTCVCYYIIILCYYKTFVRYHIIYNNFKLIVTLKLYLLCDKKYFQAVVCLGLFSLCIHVSLYILYIYIYNLKWLSYLKYAYIINNFVWKSVGLLFYPTKTLQSLGQTIIFLNNKWI